MPSGDHLFHQPSKAHSLEQVAQVGIQTGLEYCQRRLHNLSGQPVPVCRHCCGLTQQQLSTMQWLWGEGKNWKQNRTCRFILKIFTMTEKENGNKKVAVTMYMCVSRMKVLTTCTSTPKQQPAPSQLPAALWLSLWCHLVWNNLLSNSGQLSWLCHTLVAAP